MSLAPGAQIGPYEIVAPLGVGGMGEVYRARDPRLDRAVAIKILLSPHGASPAQLERFQREAQSLARISHPHICTLHDVGQHDGVAFLVMELLEGETLAERLERGAIPVDQALVIATQIAEALNALHRKDIVHRDLKPSNVMLTATGAKLLDFGLAKLRNSEYDDPAGQATKSLSLTDYGSVLGTLPYMAPEQIEGQNVDPRTDIFSFGTVLYEMIAGRRPFAGDTRASVIAGIVGVEPPLLTSVQPGVPRALERVIGRCLAKDPELRWQTARDLATELRWIAETDPDAPRVVPSASARPRRGLLVGALLIAVAAVAVFVWTRAPVAVPPPVGKYGRVTFRHGNVSSARFTPDGQSFVYSASWEGQPYDVFLGRPGSPDARDLALQTGRILSISRSGEMAVLFGPQNITHTFGVRTLGRIPMAGGARRDLLDGVVDADWIPGTDELAVVRAGGNRPSTVEFPAGNTVHETRAAWSLRVSPDGTRIAFFEGPVQFAAEPRGSVTVVDRSGRKSTLSKNWSGTGLAWAPSGTEVWFTATKGVEPPAIQAVTLSGAERTVQRAPDWLVLHDLSAQGRVLLSRNTIRVNIACQPPGELRERDLGWAVAATVRALSSDGQTLIFQEQLGNDLSSTEPIVYRRGIDGSAAVRLGQGLPLALSPDGKWVLTLQKGDLVLLPTGAGSAVTLSKGNLVRVDATGAWLSDSKRIVFTGAVADGTYRVYVQETPDGAPRAITPEGVFVPVKAAVRDDRFILGRAGQRWLLYPVEAGEPQPVPALTAQDIPIQWSSDGRFIYTATANVGGPGRPANDIFRVELESGRRILWKTLAPADPVGVEFNGGSAVITPDGRAYCYTFNRRLGDLFVLDGLK
jgi:hypothetical protein